MTDGAWQPIGRLTAQVGWLDLLGFAAAWRLVCIYHMNRVNSSNALATVNIVVVII